MRTKKFFFDRYNKLTRQVNKDVLKADITRLPLVRIKTLTKGVTKRVRAVGYVLRVFYYIDENNISKVKKTNIKNLIYSTQ